MIVLEKLTLVLVLRPISRPLFDGLLLVSDSTTFILGLFSDTEDSEFYFKNSQYHNCENIPKLLDFCPIYLLTYLLSLDSKRAASNPNLTHYFLCIFVCLY